MNRPDHHRNDPGYIEKVLKTYGELNGELHLVELKRESSSTAVGLSLAGNRDLGLMSVFVVGIQPASVAALSRLVHVGDELLEINGHGLYGRSHLNASAIIKAITCLHLRILLLRSEDYRDRIAVSPAIRLPPVDYKDSSVTLIPKKSNSLSLDDAQVQEEMTTRPVGLHRDGSEENSMPCAAAVVVIPVSKDAAVTVEMEKSILGKDETIATHLNSKLPKLENNESPRLPSQTHTKGRRLQKSAQVEDAEDEEARGAEEEQRGSGGGGEDGITHLNNQLKNQVAKPLYVEISPSGGVCDWNRCRVAEISPETSTNSSSPFHPSSGSGGVIDDPSTCAVVPGRNTTIEIRKGKVGLGLKVIGGSDTILKTIVIYEIYKNGAAAKDGRLWPGDQILEVNGHDLRDATHNCALQVMRQVTNTVKLVVFRDEAVYQDDDLYDLLTLELTKKPGKGLGLSIVSRRDDTGVQISDIVKGGVADADGRLLPGDQILSLNGDDMRKVTQEYAAELLKTSMGKITLTVGRLKVTSKSNSSRNSSSRGITKSESNVSDVCQSRRTTKRQVIGCHSVVPCLQPQD